MQVMSIHNSKGLEFPVVFLAGLGGQFNDRNPPGATCCSPRGRAGMVRREPDTGKQYNTLPRQGVALSIRRSERAEELRVLYVAMTRAKESYAWLWPERIPWRDLTRLALPSMGTARFGSGWCLPAAAWENWLLAAALRHPSGGQLRSLARGRRRSCRCSACPQAAGM